MKVITWNCNLKFKEKFELIDGYDPDICFIQECEKLNSDYFPNYKYFWTGRNEKKGLGNRYPIGHGAHTLIENSIATPTL